MSPAAEQRDTTRVKHKARILLENFPSGAHYKAKMYNYSRGGLYFESDIAFKQGITIQIQFDRPPFQSGPKTLRSVVRWCRELTDFDSDYYYGIGAKFV